MSRTYREAYPEGEPDWVMDWSPLDDNPPMTEEEADDAFEVWARVREAREKFGHECSDLHRCPVCGVRRR